MHSANRQRTLGLLAASALLIAPPAAQASDFLGYIHAGGALPVHPGEFGEFWNTGWSLGGGFGLPISPEFMLAVQFTHQRHGSDGAAQAEDLLLTGPGGVVVEVESLEGRGLSVTSILAEARVLAPSTNPARTWFVSFGVGAANVSTADATVIGRGLTPVVVSGDADAAFATSFGGGVEIDLNSTVRLTLDSAYTIIFTDGERTHGPSTQFLPLRIGLAFRMK